MIQEECYASNHDNDELDRLRAAHAVLSDLKKAEERSNLEGWVSDEEMQKEMGLED